MDGLIVGVNADRLERGIVCSAGLREFCPDYGRGLVDGESVDSEISIAL